MGVFYVKQKFCASSCLITKIKKWVLFSDFTYSAAGVSVFRVTA